MTLIEFDVYMLYVCVRTSLFIALVINVLGVVITTAVATKQFKLACRKWTSIFLEFCFVHQRFSRLLRSRN